MTESGVRELFRDATSEAALGESTVDVDAVIARERRIAVRRRIGLTVGAVAVAAGLAVALPAVVGGSPNPSPFASSGATPSQTLPPSATRPEREDLAFQALREHFPGAVRRPVAYTEWDGRISVEADLPGPPPVLVFLEALRVQERPEHPCGPTGPPACVEYVQPDGSTVMVQRIEDEIRLGGVLTVVAIHLRTNGTHVQVGVSYDPDLTAPYTDDVMVRAAVDPRFTAMTPGTGG
jgi:hypothetical protein